MFAFSVVVGVLDRPGVRVGARDRKACGRRVAGGPQAQPGRASAPRGARRLRTTLATAQIALAVALLSQSGLFLRSLVNISRLDTGMRRDGLVMFSLFPGLNGYSPERACGVVRPRRAVAERCSGRAFGQRVVDTGVGRDNRTNNVTVERFNAPEGADTRAATADIGPRYFATVGLPLLSGREFTSADDADAPKVAIVNEAFARKFNLGASVIGARMARGEGGNRPLDIEIVGLVRDAQFSELRGAPPPQFFVPFRQVPVGPLTFYVHVDPSNAVAVHGGNPGGRGASGSQPAGGGPDHDDRSAVGKHHARPNPLDAVYIVCRLATAARGGGPTPSWPTASRAVYARWVIRMALGATGGQVAAAGPEPRVPDGDWPAACWAARGHLARPVGPSRCCSASRASSRGRWWPALDVVMTFAFPAGAIPRGAAAVNPADALRAE